MNNIDDRIRQIMSDVFEVDMKEITQDSSQDNLSNWDSLHHLNLIVALEEEFEVSIPVEDVATLTNFAIVSCEMNELLSKEKNN